MKQITPLLLLFLLSSLAFAQSKQEFKFDQARVLLAQREIKPAIEILESLHKELPDNANINFLLGAAYTELNGEQEEGLEHLLMAGSNVNESYMVGSFEEKAAPIHVYYYLTVAFAEDNRCAEAQAALDLFEKYKEKVDGYFIEEGKRHIQKCDMDSNAKPVDLLAILSKSKPLPKKENRKVENTPIILDSAAIAERGMLVHKLEYSTDAPLYGVQIASHLKPVPISNYGNLKNVNVFVGNKGYIRYVVGHFSYRSQAESLLKRLQEQGYKDAFIVNVNNARKYSNELISFNNVNVRSGIKGAVEYYIQLGAFKKKLTEDQINAYINLDGVEEISYNGLNILAVSGAETYKATKEKLKDVHANGYKDAYIIAFNKGKKVPLENAKLHTDK